MFGKLSETKTKLLQTSPTFSISDVFFNYGATSFSRFNFLENGKVKTMSADQRKSWRTDEQIFEGVYEDEEKIHIRIYTNKKKENESKLRIIMVNLCV